MKWIILNGDFCNVEQIVCITKSGTKDLIVYFPKNQESLYFDNEKMRDEAFDTLCAEISKGDTIIFNNKKL